MAAATAAAPTTARRIQPVACQTVVVPDHGVLGSAGDHLEARFSRGPDGPFVDEQVGSFATAQAATQAQQLFQNAAARCPSWTEDDVAFTIGEISFRRLTPQLTATRVTSADFGAYLVVAVQGRWVMTLTASGQPLPNIDDVRTMVAAALRRLPTT